MKLPVLERMEAVLGRGPGDVGMSPAVRMCLCIPVVLLLPTHQSTSMATHQSTSMATHLLHQTTSVTTHLLHQTTSITTHLQHQSTSMATRLLHQSTSLHLPRALHITSLLLILARRPKRLLPQEGRIQTSVSQVRILLLL